MIYLASPYSHPDPAIEVHRYATVCRIAAKLMREGHKIFSPIAHSHSLKVHGTLPGGWDFWQTMDEEMIGFCDAVCVLMLDGWKHSKGVQAEIKIALKLGKPIYYIDLDNAKLELRENK